MLCSAGATKTHDSPPCYRLAVIRRHYLDSTTPALAHCFLRRLAAEAPTAFTGITPEALERLGAYDWPGNVRDLSNVIERAVVLGVGPEVRLQDLPPWGAAAPPHPSSPGASYHEAIAAYKRELIVGALAHARGNHTAAAQLLGLQRAYLQRLLKALHLNRLSLVCCQFGDCGREVCPRPPTRS
jgi:DNA-binding NtrC family response regulator